MMGTNEENEIKSQPEYDVFYSSSEDEAHQIAVKACQECTCERKIERPKIEKHLVFLGLLIPMCLSYRFGDGFGRRFLEISDLCGIVSFSVVFVEIHSIFVD